MICFGSRQFLSRQSLVAAGLLLLTPISAIAANSDFDAGMKLIKQGQYQKSLSCFDKSVDMEPTNGDFHFWRGKCLAGLGKKAEASAEFKLAALLSTDSKIKEACKVELSRYKQAVPRGSVNEKLSANGTGSSGNSREDDAPTIGKNDKVFKLSSKKLDWNLQMRSDYLQSMKAKTDALGSLASGTRWQSHAPNVGGGPGPILRAALSGPAHFTVPLTAGERLALTGSDIVIILDHSGSMFSPDCPGSGGRLESRLAWAVEEMEYFADTLCSSLPHGFELITFDSTPEVFRVQSTSQLREVLHNLKGGGGTDLPSALKEAFRVHNAHPKAPLLIAVVSDGEVDLRSSEKTIVEASRQYPLPAGVFITLLQIGINAEIHTSGDIGVLDNLQSRAGAAYDAFSAVPFSKVRADGLGRSILFGLRSRAFANSEGAAGNSSASGLSPSSSKVPATTSQLPSTNTSGQTSPALQVPSMSEPASSTSRTSAEANKNERELKEARQRYEREKAKKEEIPKMWQNGDAK